MIFKIHVEGLGENQICNKIWWHTSVKIGDLSYKATFFIAERFALKRETNVISWNYNFYRIF
jgi:hypothetical protein